LTTVPTLLTLTSTRQHRTPIVVVQNVYPSETPPALGQRVAVRVVNNSARVIANPLPPEAEALLAAAGPMPVPLQGAPAVASLPPVESYGYRQALGQALYQHWTIEP